jgi:hypothetical protein
MALAIDDLWWTMPSWCWKHHTLHRAWHGRVVQATFKGAAEIGFTVVSMSVSLVAVFIPLLMMGGIVASVPRIRGHAQYGNRRVAAGLAHHHPHDVRQFLRPAKTEKTTFIEPANGA